MGTPSFGAITQDAPSDSAGDTVPRDRGLSFASVRGPLPGLSRSGAGDGHRSRARALRMGSSSCSTCERRAAEEEEAVAACASTSPVSERALDVEVLRGEACRGVSMVAPSTFSRRPSPATWSPRPLPRACSAVGDMVWARGSGRKGERAASRGGLRCAAVEDRARGRAQSRAAASGDRASPVREGGGCPVASHSLSSGLGAGARVPVASGGGRSGGGGGGASDPVSGPGRGFGGARRPCWGDKGFGAGEREAEAECEAQALDWPRGEGDRERKEAEGEAQALDWPRGEGDRERKEAEGEAQALDWPRGEGAGGWDWVRGERWEKCSRIAEERHCRAPATAALPEATEACGSAGPPVALGGCHETGGTRGHSILWGAGAWARAGEGGSTGGTLREWWSCLMAASARLTSSL